MEAIQPQEHKYRVLVAEDSPTQRQIIKSVLSREGFEVVLACDGIEAVTQAFSMNPDIIVLDIEMPRMNGYQVCRLLKDDRRTAHIPVVMLTSRSQETDKFWGLKTGADRYVTKDFKLTGLGASVHELLEERGAADDYPKQGIAHAMFSKQDETDVLSRVNDLLDRKLYEATIINEISKLNTLSEDCAITVSSVLSVIAKVTDCYICSVLLVDELELIMHVHNAVGKEYFDLSKSQAFEAASGYLLPGTTIKELDLIIDADPVFLEGSHPECDSFGSVLTIPLMARGKTIAVLTLNSPKSDAFVEDIRQVLDILEYPASVVVDNARLHEGTKRLAVTDGLTRLFNHRHFYELLEQEFLRTKRYKTQLAMIMIDIDFFKHINDTYGHQVGDDILKSMALVIQRQVRDVDILARYGGEEFAVLMPQTSLRQAETVAERIRHAVEHNEFDASEGKIRLTISLGIAAYPECEVESQTELVQVADAALYEAKKTGKNKVVVGGVR
ncbi:MAG: diguanylate cyclase [Actinobacteria bacterium]|nr:diguanylate cyclase [Actinomycetota bacterium]